MVLILRCCQEEKVKLIDGWRHHVTMGIGSETEHTAQSVTVLVGRFSKDRW